MVYVYSVNIKTTGTNCDGTCNIDEEKTNNNISVFYVYQMPHCKCEKWENLGFACEFMFPVEIIKHKFNVKMKM